MMPAGRTDRPASAGPAARAGRYRRTAPPAPI